MRFRTIVAVTGGAAASLVLASGPAFAGEINGNGQFTPNHEFGHSHSICSFSGLEDGDGAGFPGPAVRPRRTGATARRSTDRPRPSARRRASSPVTPATDTGASW